MTTTTFTPPIIRKHGLAAEWRALRAVVRREWTIFRRYPSWIIALFIWPIIFPMAYILSSQALAGPNSGGLLIFQRNAGTTDVVGYIVIGTIIWMWQNVVLVECGLCAARRADARHAGKQLAVTLVALLAAAGQQRGADGHDADLHRRLAAGVQPFCTACASTAIRWS